MTDPTTIHMLRAVRETLVTEIAPNVQGADASVSADIVARLLEWVALRLEHGEQVEAKRDAALVALLGEGWQTSHEPIASLVAAGNPREVAALLAAEQEYVVALDPDGSADAADSYLAGRAAARQVQTDPYLVTDDRLTEYLRARFPEYPGILARDTNRLAGGLGKDTVLFTIENGGPVSGQVVMRKDLPISPIESVANDELPLLRAAEKLGIPVASPMWGEEDRSWFNAGFIIVRRVPGTVDLQSWVGDPEQVRNFARTLAEVMARIHSLDPHELGLNTPIPSTATQGTRDEVLKFRDLFRRKENRVNTRLEAAFAWLLDNVPDCGDAPARLVHGDIGFHNLLIEKGEVTAVLDWEFTHFGDPAEDVSYVRPFVERVMPWTEFLDIYRSCGGQPYSEAQDRFFAVWRDARNAASCTGSVFAFLAAPVGSVKMATGGLVYGPRFEIDALKSIKENLS